MPDDPQAPALPMAQGALSSPGDSSTVLGAHPAASDTTYAATCAALCGSDSATESRFERELSMPNLKISGRGFIFHFNNGVKVRVTTYK